MEVDTLRDLLVKELSDIYSAEKQILKALPKMAKAASSDKLKQAFTQHLEETKGQIERLEQIFESLDLRTRGKPCEAMQGLVEEGKEVMEEVKQPEVLDAALIVSAQKVEHYEIASYGSLRTLAESLGHKDAAKLLDQTLAEEKKADELLNKLALGDINKRAMQQAA